MERICFGFYAKAYSISFNNRAAWQAGAGIKTGSVFSPVVKERTPRLLSSWKKTSENHKVKCGNEEKT